MIYLGRKVGVVTTARITHATPAASYAHVADRDWEGYDSRRFGNRETREGCLDIAHQLVSRSPPIDLAFGGGRRFFYPNTKPDWEYTRMNGSRTDNRSLIDDIWPGRFIWNRTEMNRIPLGSVSPLLGLFERDHLFYETDRVTSGNDEPSLAEMTRFAIEHFLAMNASGFFLLIEGGKIDHGHHSTNARYALDEFVQFDEAIGQARRIFRERNLLDDTLLVVTADHSHVFTMGAYSARGSNILGFSTLENMNVSDVDQAPINIIAYGNGPNFRSSRNATYLATLDTNSTNYLSPTALPLGSESHGGEDVPIYAHGPWSHLFIGTMEQHTIAHKMAYAACWGAYANRKGCESTPSSASTRPQKSNEANFSHRQSSILELFIFFLLLHSFVTD